MNTRNYHSRQIQKAVSIPSILLTLLLLLLPLTASAETVQKKSYSLLLDGSTGIIQETPHDTAAFWEFPTIPAGQTNVNGELTVVNHSAEAVDFYLKEIELPYNNTKALAYLDSLHIIVQEGKSVLYNGTYSRIAEVNGLTMIKRSIQPDEQVTYTISLYCDFDYTGDVYTASVPVPWRFSATTALSKGKADSIGPVKPPVSALVVLCIAGVIVIVCAAFGTRNLPSKRKAKY